MKMEFFTFPLNGAYLGIYLLVLIIGFYLGRKSINLTPKILPDRLIPLNTKEGSQLLLESNLNKAHFLLSCYHITQKNTTFCGIASIAMVLNSFNDLKKETPKIGNCSSFTQTNIFNKEVDKIKSSLNVSLIGTNLEELKNILLTYKIKATVVYGTDINVDEFREVIREYLAGFNCFIIVNYWRKAIGQLGLGHVSPISAYNQQEDRFLILDVARNKYPPFWVKTEELWQATATIDIVSKKSRGLLLIKN